MPVQTSATTPEEIARLKRRIHTQLQLESVDSKRRKWVKEMLFEHSADIRRAQEGNYQDFLVTYIKREKFKYQYPPESSKNPDGETRERPLCTCGEGCEIMAAEEPYQFKEYDDPEKGIRAYKREHPGAVLVLDEARKEWYEMQGRAESILHGLLIVLNGGDIPEDGSIESESRSELRAAIAEGDADGQPATEGNGDEGAGPDGQEDVDEAISEVAAGGD